MKLKLISNEELLLIAIRKFGSRDCVRPKFPRRGEDIQDAMESAAGSQLNQDRENILEVIRDWERLAAPETENGEEEFKKKYGKGTTELIDIIEEAMKD